MASDLKATLGRKEKQVLLGWMAKMAMTDYQGEKGEAGEPGWS